MIRCFREGDFAPSAWFFNTHDFHGPIEARPRPHRSAHFEPIGLLEEQGPPRQARPRAGKRNNPWDGSSPAVGEVDRDPPMTADSSAIEYRELQRADLPSFEKVVLQGLGALERATGLDQTSLTQIQSLRRWGIWALLTLLRALGQAPIRVFVAIERGEVVATASVLLLSETGYVAAVATDSAARGRGIATHLLEQARTLTHRKGRAWLALDVEAQNETAIRVYRRLGYAETARFGWYVGSTPSAGAPIEGTATEVPRSKRAELAAWVDRLRPPAIHDPLPATARRLSHLEISFGTPQTRVKTWRLSGGGEIVGVVRAIYSPKTQTGFVIPAGWDPAASGTALRDLVTPAVTWLQTLGTPRTVVVVPDPPGTWEPVLAALGLPKAVSTTLMVRSSAA